MAELSILHARDTSGRYIGHVDDLGDPVSYLVLSSGTPVYASDGPQVGEVAHVLADEHEDVFDGIVIAEPAGHRFADADLIDRIFERGVTLTTDAAAAAQLPVPSANPAVMRTGPDDATESRTHERLRRAWDLISGR